MLCFACSDTEKTCTIKGTIQNYNCDTIIMTKVQDVHGVKETRIPILDNSFNYKLSFPFTEAYRLKFMEGQTRRYSVIFFPRRGKVVLKIGSENTDDSEYNYQVSGGRHNRILNKTIRYFRTNYLSEYFSISDSINTILMINGYDREEHYSLAQELSIETDSLKRNLLNRRIKEILDFRESSLSKVLPIIESADIIYSQGLEWLMDSKIQNYSLTAYTHFLERLFNIYSSDVEEADDDRENYEVFKKKYPGHPYNKIVEDILMGQEQIFVGGKYIDFTAPSIDGKKFSISELITGKYAIIDCWYTWCGPCIRKSRAMKPVYYDYQNQGFTIVGIAGHNNDIQAVKQRLDIEKYPWLTLVAPEGRNTIWDKYDISNSGGSQFFVDPKGKIIAINPSAEEVRKALEAHL